MPLIGNFSFDNYGLGGFEKDAPPVLLTSGIQNASTSLLSQRFHDRASQGSAYYIVAAGLDFKGAIPKLILIKQNGAVTGIYVRDAKNQFGDSLISWNNFVSCVGSLTTDNFYVTTNSFRLQVSQTQPYNWEAWG
ncbi:hypothetical protein ACN9MH_15460 [Paenibacillus silvae]|uniref:hypothetical protein n=1 Tax=Paenibacillus silvae TaxID=1325358 RepID=UPI003CF31E61